MNKSGEEEFKCYCDSRFKYKIMHQNTKSIMALKLLKPSAEKLAIIIQLASNRNVD